LKLKIENREKEKVIEEKNNKKERGKLTWPQPNPAGPASQPVKHPA
jgi:hypothetical protein